MVKHDVVYTVQFARIKQVDRMPTIVVSNDANQLCTDLIDEIKAIDQDRLITATIVVPEASIRSWLCHELAKQGLSILRFEILIIDVVFQKRVPTPLILFGFTALQSGWLEQLWSQCTSLYALSPCMLFWGDLCSDVKARSLLAKARQSGVSHPSEERLEELLFDRHRLLANSGHIGREFLHLLEEKQPEGTKNRYVFPDSLCIPPYTEYLQPEVIIEERHATLLDYVKADMLLLVGKVPSRTPLMKDGSIELHAAPTPLREVEALRERLSRMSHLQPASVIVLVSDLARYAAAMEEVFGGQRGPFFQLIGSYSPDGPITALQGLIRLLSSKNSLSEWRELLHHPLIQQKLSLSPQDAEALQGWLKKKTPAWGLSHEHRARYLQQRGIEPKGKNGGIADEKEAFLATFFTPPDQYFSCSDLPAIGSFWQFLAQLEPFTLAKEAPLSEWKNLFLNLSEGLLTTGSGYEEEAIGEALSLLEGTSPIAWDEAQTLFFSLVEAAYDRRHIDLKSPMIVAELGRFQPFPAELVAILGAQEGQLPRYSRHHLLRRLHKMADPAHLSNIFLERYALIEATLSAKNLFIGYQSIDCATQTQVPLAPAITDIFTHLDERYRLDGIAPSTALKTGHGMERPFRQEFEANRFPNIVLKKSDERFLRIDPQALKKAAKYPLELYYKAHLGYDTPFKDEDPLFVKPWQVKQAVPSWATQQVENTLTALGATSPPYDLHLVPTAKEPSFDDMRRQIVCPTIQCSESMELSGVWPALRMEGTVLIREDWKRELFQQWPEIVFRSSIQKAFGVPLQPHLIIVSENRVQAIESPKEFSDWIAFAHEATVKPFPFTFDIVKRLCAENDDVVSAIQSHAEQVGGVWRFVTNDEIQEKLPLWKEWAHKLYTPFFEAL